MNPEIAINISKLKENAKFILDLCHKNKIEPFFVGKVLAGDATVINTIIECGFKYYADSRIENLQVVTTPDVKKVLLRVPAISEVNNVVSNCDISLNSELEVIRALNLAAKEKKTIHEIILMIDLGDLREGIFFQDDYMGIISEILTFKNIKLVGLGTNLTCYGGIIPTYDNLNILVEIKKQIKKSFDYEVEIISGGNSSSLVLLNKGLIPRGINNLRIGEALLLARETAYGNFITGMNNDNFILKAEIIELKTKPSYPMGTMTMDAFGNIPNIRNQGLMRRGILAIGKQDVLFENISPIDKSIKVIGGSSDHLIVDLTYTNYNIGDKISFNLNYAGLLQVMTSPYVTKSYFE
jgi:predicted amino acid racemase